MAKGKKDFKEKIGEDFKAIPIEEEAPTKARTKAVPRARLIPIADIVPDQNQPREKLDQEKLNELAASIKSRGVIEPITVRFIEDDSLYRIVTGERRYKAAEIAGLTEIPCIIKDLSDQEALIYQLIENLQREDLSPIDEATALRNLSNAGLNQTEISKLIGKSQPYISKLLNILELPESILAEAREIEVSKEHLLALLKSENPEQLWEQIKTGATAEQVKEAVKKPSKGRPRIKPWTWKPEDKSFTIQIKFKERDYDREKIIEALELILKKLREG